MKKEQLKAESSQCGAASVASYNNVECLDELTDEPSHLYLQVYVEGVGRDSVLGTRCLCGVVLSILHRPLTVLPQPILHAVHHKREQSGAVRPGGRWTV